MSRTATMTIGFLLIFIGLQMNFVETYVLSPTATKFIAERFDQPADAAGQQGNMFSNPFSQAAYPGNGLPSSNVSLPGISPNQKQITPSDWLCWPMIFVGAAFVLHGLAVHRGT